MDRKSIACVAHDNKKDDLLRGATHNRPLLAQHTLFATGMNVGSADFINNNPLIHSSYKQIAPDYAAHNNQLNK